MKNIEKNIIVLQEVDSTNNYANRLIQLKVAKEGTAVLAHYQKSGRGQAGNFWESKPNQNLLMSFILFPDFLQAGKQFYLSKIASLALFDFFIKSTQNVSIKWPNDIYIANKKIAGTLIENAIIGDRISSSVLGIGLNINQKKFSAALPNPISLSQITNLQYDILQLANTLINHIEFWYKKLIKLSFEEIDKHYLNKLYKKDEWIHFKNENETFEARINSIGEFGHLILEDRNGKKKKFMFKEVEYVL